MPYGSEGLYLLPRYGVAVDDPLNPYLIEIEVQVVDGQPRCEELRCRQRPDGPPVSSENLRKVRLGGYLRLSAVAMSFHAVLDENGDVLFAQATGTGDEELLARAAVRRPRVTVTEDLLRRVAQIHRDGGPKGTLAVQRHYSVSRATAARWVRAARERGFINDTKSNTNNKEATP